MFAGTGICVAIELMIGGFLGIIIIFMSTAIVFGIALEFPGKWNTFYKLIEKIDKYKFGKLAFWAACASGMLMIWMGFLYLFLTAMVLVIAGIIDEWNKSKIKSKLADEYGPLPPDIDVKNAHRELLGG